MANEFVARKGIISLGVISGSTDLIVAQDGTIGGNLTVGGTITAQEFKAELISSSIIYESGSTKFGDSLDDVHQRTGSYFISGSSFSITSSAFSLFGSSTQNGTSTITGQLTVDNIRLDGNTLSSTGGNIFVVPEGTNDIFLNADTIVTGSLTLNKGSFQSPDYTALGYSGKGFKLISGSDDRTIGGSNQTSGYKLELDHLRVRGTMEVYELLINQIRATNGTLFVSSVGKVDSVQGNGPGPTFTSFILNFDTGSDGFAGHGFAVDDIIRAQRFKRDGTGGSIYQSDLQVTSVSGVQTIVVDKVGTTGDPQPGYEYVRLGNVSDDTRKGTVYLTADDQNAPYINVIDGVTSHANWNTQSVLKTRMGKLDGITNTSFGDLSGYGFYASGSAFLEGGINATTGKIANWVISGNTITSSNLHLTSSEGGVIRMGATLPASHTSGTGIFLSGSGQGLIGDASGARIQFDGSNLILSSSTFLLGNSTNFVSGSGGNIRISGSNVRVETPSFLLGDGSNFVSGSGGNIRISGSNVQVLTPTFFFGGANQFISGSGGNIEISSSNFHLLNGNITASNGIFSGQITATTGSFTGNVNVGSGVIIGPNAVITLPTIVSQSFSSSSVAPNSTITSFGTSFSSSAISTAKDELIKTTVTITTGSNYQWYSSPTPKATVYVALLRGDDDLIIKFTEVVLDAAISEDISPLNRTVTLFHSNVENYSSYKTYVEISYNWPSNVTFSGGKVLNVISGSILKTVPNLAIRETGIFTNYGDGERNLLELALDSSTTTSAGSGGGGGISSIVAGEGLSGGTITSTGTIALNTGSAHFTSGVKTKLNTDGVFSGSAQVDITSTTGTLAVNRGGTNSTATLNNNRVIISNGNAIVEAGAITANRALISDANGLPTQSATTATELGYVNGVTSAIQTQLNNKLGTTLNSANIFVGNGSNVATGVAMSADATLSNTGALTIANNAVTSGKFRQSAGFSIVGKATTGAGNVDDIVAGSDHQVLRRSGTSIAFGAISLDQTNAVTGTLPVGNGGTGATSFTANRLLIGNTTSAITTSANLTFSNNNLSVTGSVGINESSYGAQINSEIPTGQTGTVASVPTGSFNGVFFDYTIGLSTEGRRVGTVMATWLPGSTTVEFTDFSTLDIGNTAAIVMLVDINLANVRLRANNTGTTGPAAVVRTMTRAI